MREAWRLLQDFGTEVIIVGHDHGYERFAPQTVDGRRDERFGIEQIVVGTGGAPLYNFIGAKPNSERQIKEYGIIKLALHNNSYDHAFISINDPNTMLDPIQNVACH